LHAVLLDISGAGLFALVDSVWGHFGHDISVLKQLITFFIEMIILADEMSRKLVLY